MLRSLCWCMTTLLFVGAVLELASASRSEGNDRALPGIRARITQRGLDYGAKLAVDLIMKNPDKMKIPEFPVTVGATTMTLADVVIKRLPRPLLRLFLIPGNVTNDSIDAGISDGGRMQANVTNLNPTVDATLKISQNWGLFTTKRDVNVTATMKQMEVSIHAFIGIDESGRPLPSDIQCHATGDVSFVLKGEFRRWTWFVNTVYNTMKNQFRESVFGQICSNIVLEMNNFVENDLKTLPSTVDFERDYTFDFRLLAEPKISDRFVEFLHKGSVMLLRNSTSATVLHVPAIPAFPRHSEKMVYLYITDSVVNSAWYAAMENGQLNVSVSENTTGVPAIARSYLSTTCPGSTCLGTMFPHLAISHPNTVATVAIRAANTSYPPFHFSGSSIRVRCKGIADFFVNSEKILSISLTLASSINMSVSADQFHFTIPENSFRLDGDILSTPSNLVALVPVIEPILDSYLGLLSNYVFVPALQAVGRQGLPLIVPTIPDLKFLNAVIIDQRAQNILAVGTDIEYTVPRLEK